jgi:hypothetical protein
MSTPLTFTLREGFDDDSDSPIQYGAFSRDWADEEAPSSPAHWYQAGQIAFRDGNYVSANPYIAEGLTGRTVLTEHLYWHASSIYGPEWAADYLNAPEPNRS